MCKYKVKDWVGATGLIIKLKPTDYECTFSRRKAGPRPLPGDVHVKIQMGMARPILLGLKFGQILFFFWGGGYRKLALFFRLHKATATVALFHPRLQCNFQKLFAHATAMQ